MWVVDFMDDIFIILICTNLLVLAALAALSIKAFKLKKDLDSTRTLYKSLDLKYKLNPDYDSQRVMAEMLTGGGLFKVEKIDSADLYVLRR